MKKLTDKTPALPKIISSNSEAITIELTEAGSNKSGENASLSKDERAKLHALEAEAAAYIKGAAISMYRFGCTFDRIREGRLYREFGTWEEYGKKRWHLKKSQIVGIRHFRRIVDVVVPPDVIAAISAGSGDLPGKWCQLTESAVRPMERLTNDECKACAVEIEREIGNGEVTPTIIKRVASKLYPKPKKPKKRPTPDPLLVQRWMNAFVSQYEKELWPDIYRMIEELAQENIGGDARRHGNHANDRTDEAAAVAPTPVKPKRGRRPKKAIVTDVIPSVQDESEEEDRDDYDDSDEYEVPTNGDGIEDNEDDEDDKDSKPLPDNEQRLLLKREAGVISEAEFQRRMTALES
jgi:hypothetical protein